MAAYENLKKQKNTGTVAAYENLKKQKNKGTYLKNDSKGFRFSVNLRPRILGILLKMKYSKSQFKVITLIFIIVMFKIAILQYSYSVLVVKIIAKYVKELIVNKASGLQTTTLIKIELFDRYFSRILSKGVEQLFR